MRDPTRFHQLRRRISENRQLIAYLLCSLVTTAAEMLLGWMILSALPGRILVANTLSLTVGGAAHWYMTTKYAFRARHTVVGAGLYAATFLLGLFIQNLAVSILYKRLLDPLPEGAQYLVSKLVSMALALAVTYLMRDYIHRAIERRARKRRR